ncbi:MAG: hypothetical protein PHX21_01935 [bacterium]|nr:hypothetical protein [bacterium]
MKKFIGSVFVGILLFSTVNANIVSGTKERIQMVGDSLLNNVIDGMKTNDYAKYSRDFDATMKDALSEKTFAITNKQITELFGEYKNSEYLGSLNQKKTTMFLWKGVFSKSQDDILIKLVVSEIDGKCLISGLWFQ